MQMATLHRLQQLEHLFAVTIKIKTFCNSKIISKKLIEERLIYYELNFFLSIDCSEPWSLTIHLDDRSDDGRVAQANDANTALTTVTCVWEHLNSPEAFL